MEPMESQEEMMKVDAAIMEAEKEFAENGITYDAREALSFLRKKHFG